MEIEHKTLIADNTFQTAANDSTDVRTMDIYSVDFYVDRLPTEKEDLDSLKTERNFANYQLGTIYKEKFLEYDLAVYKFNNVLQSDPEEKLIVPSKYNLYKIYELQNSPKASPLKLNIISEHRDSRYAQILANPELVLSDGEDSPESKYNELFRRFEKQDYETVIFEAEKYITRYSGEAISTKFEMLKASAIGRLKGFEAYKKALNYIALNYPNKEEGQEAQKILDVTLVKIENKNFADSTAKSTWKLVFPFQRDRVFEIKKVKESAEKAIKSVPQRKLSLSDDIYDSDQRFIVIHNFPSQDQALGFAEFLKINKDYLLDSENFVISSLNYKIIQIHKNLNEYLTEVINPNLKFN